MYLDDRSNIGYETYLQLIDELKSELESIRERCRISITNADTLVQSIQGDTLDPEIRKKYYDVMKTISLDCSEAMRKFGERIIRESVGIISNSPPCSFEAVAIGSIARCEATPYSDLEYLFLVDKDSDDAVRYFEVLAMVSYFIMGNLGETKLSYMAIKELHGWFDDQAKNGFKIDGLAKGAGNIPTGNSLKNRNHFIITPEKLAVKYKAVLNNPDPDEALRGDLTAMLAYTASLYSHQNEKSQLLHRFKQMIEPLPVNQSRADLNMRMLKADARKFNFVPDVRLAVKGYNCDVKKEVYRFPSILLLDICIVCGCAERTSWASLEALAEQGKVSQDLCSSLKFLLAAATYIRLSTYLHHDSHDDRMALTQQLADNSVLVKRGQSTQQSTQRWFLPCELFSGICTLMIPLKRYLGKESFDIQELKSFSEESHPWWSRVITMYHSGNETQALSTLTQRCVNICHNPVESALQLHSTLPHRTYDTLIIISETLFWCGNERAALQIYQYMTDNDISDERQRIADCHMRLGQTEKSIEICNSITDKSAEVYYTLGQVQSMTGQYDMAEHNYLQALIMEYNNASAEPLTDYYGNPLTTECDTQSKVSFIDAASPEDILAMITHITPHMITRLASLGNVYNDQKKFSTAEAYYMKALQFAHNFFGEGSAQRIAAELLYSLGNNYCAMEQFDKAVDYLQRALAVHREISGGTNSQDIALTLYNLGYNFGLLKQTNNAMDYYEQALSVFKELSKGTENKSVADTLHVLGDRCSDMEQYEKAMEYYQQALSAYTEIAQGVDSEDAANTLRSLGQNCRNMKQNDKAEDYYLRALAIYRDSSQGTSCEVLAGTLFDLGSNYKEMELSKKAVNYYQQALSVYRDISHGTEKSIADTLYALGASNSDMEQYDEAVDYYHQALSGYKEISQGSGSEDIADAMNNLAECYDEMEQYEKAESYFLQALAVYKQISQGAGDINIANTLANLGNNNRSREQHDQSEDYYQQALSIYREIPQGAGSEDEAHTLLNLGVSTSCTKQFDKAECHFKQALSVYREISQGANSEDIANALNNLGNTYTAMEQYDKAEDTYQQALMVYREISQGADSDDIANIMINLGSNYDAAGVSSKARDTLTQAFSMLLRVDPRNRSVKRVIKYLSQSKGDIEKAQAEIAFEINVIGAKYKNRRQHSKAKDCFNQALAIYRQLPPGVSSVNISRTLIKLALNCCEMKKFTEADRCLKEASVAYKGLPENEDNVLTADTLCNMALCYLYRGHNQAAMEIFTKAYNIYKRVNPNNPHVHVIQKYMSLASGSLRMVFVEKRKGDPAPENSVSDPKYLKLS